MTAATMLGVPQGSLRRSSLPGWTPVAVGAGALVIAGALRLLGVLGNVAVMAIVAALLYVIVLPVLTFVVEGRRRATDRLVTALVGGAFLVALVPLVSVLYIVIARGAKRFDATFFTHSLGGITANDAGGGAYHAIIGTLEQVGIAAVLSIPLGMLTAVYLVEYGKGRFARTVSYFVDVMTGLPSVVAGLFILAAWVLALNQGFSGLAAALALAVLMLPIVSRATEEMLRLVPDGLREASFALGVPRWRTILKVVLPTALPGIVTGVMLAIARVFGETAPVLLVAFGNDFINNDPFKGPQASLPLFVYQQALSPNSTAVDRAWTAALVLILIVMVLSLLARVATRRNRLAR